MSTAPFGAAGFGFPPFDAGDWERTARQWFASMSPPPARPVAADPFAWWRPAQPAAASADPAALAGQWMTQIQQLAAQFAGREAAPVEIVRAWRSMLGENPFASGVAGAAFMPMAFFGTGSGQGPLDMPAFGYTREHQERMQDFARATAQFQQAAQAFQAIVGEAGQDAFTRFESLLAQRTGEGKPLESSRALFDLWIDAAEDAYADIALSERFQRAFGDYVNAQMRVRSAMQKEVELACEQWGIPGRSEIDAAHRKVAGLERELRRLRDRLDAIERPAGAAGQAPAAAATAPAKPNTRAGAKPAAKTPRKR